MPQTSALVAKVRAYLGFPATDAPTEGQILHALYDHNQNLVNEMHLTQEGWLVRRFYLHVTSDRTVYPVSEEDFLGAALVETDPTHYPTTNRRRKVNVVNFQDLHLVEPRSRLSDAAVTTTEPDLVTAVAFRNVEGSWEAVTAPAGAEGHYVIWYEPGFVAPTAMENAPAAIPAFHPLLAMLAALSVLPHARWEGMDATEQRTHRAELRDALARDAALHMDTFARYRFMKDQPSQETITPFGSSRRAVRRARSSYLKSLNWP